MIVVAAILLSLAAAEPAVASVGLELTTQAQLQDGSLRVQLQVRNVGDEAGLELRPSVRFQGHSVQGERRPRLEPDETWTTRLEVPSGALRPGHWPYRLSVRYTDANQYPLQAIQMGVGASGALPPAELTLAPIDPIRLRRSGRLEARIRNSGDRARTVVWGAYLPDALSSVAPQEPITLQPGEERLVSLPLFNRSALAGSRYAAFLSAEYDTEEVHQTVVAPLAVEIAVPQAFLEAHRTQLWTLSMGIVVAWLCGLAWRRLRHVG